jgi:hypothetical protein
MNTHAKGREIALQSLIRDIIMRELEAERRSRLAQFEAKRAEAKVEIHRRVDEKREEIAEKIASSLESALKSTVQTMESNLQAEKTRIAAGQGSKEQEATLALQLAATLATAHQKGAELETNAWAKLKDAREKSLAKVEGIATPDILAKPVEAAFIEEVLKDHLEKATKYLQAMDKAEEAANNFIVNSSPTAGIKAFFSGALGTDLGSVLGRALDKGTARMQTAFEDKVKKITDEKDTAINTINKK